MNSVIMWIRFWPRIKLLSYDLYSKLLITTMTGLFVKMIFGMYSKMYRGTLLKRLSIQTSV